LQFHNLGWVHRDGQAHRKIEAELGVVLSCLSPREFDSLLSWESISQTCGATKEAAGSAHKTDRGCQTKGSGRPP
jgi:hypothetical protein